MLWQQRTSVSATILKKSNVRAGNVQETLLKESPEQALYAAVSKLEPQLDQLLEQGDFAGALKTMAHLRDQVDAFFDTVMVMAEDLDLRNNRIALLTKLYTIMNRVADISTLAS